MYQIRPVKFKQASNHEIIEFVDVFLSDNMVTEKVAGQHLTVNIIDNWVYVNTKDQLIQNKPKKDALKTKWGRRITRGLVQYLKYHKLADQTWTFEIVNPRTNHDFIRYKTGDSVVFVE